MDSVTARHTVNWGMLSYMRYETWVLIIIQIKDKIIY